MTDPVEPPSAPSTEADGSLVDNPTPAKGATSINHGNIYAMAEGKGAQLFQLFTLLEDRGLRRDEFLQRQPFIGIKPNMV